MATCPNCGISSRNEPDAISVVRALVPDLPRKLTLIGSEPDTRRELRLTCKCGWSIAGYLDFANDSFLGNPRTQRWPEVRRGGLVVIPSANDADGIRHRIRGDLEEWLDTGIVQALASVQTDSAARVWRVVQDLEYATWREVIRIIAGDLSAALVSGEISTEGINRDR